MIQFENILCWNCQNVTFITYAYCLSSWKSNIKEQYIKCIKAYQIHFNFIDVLLLYYGHQHLSATRVPTVRVISLRTRIQL